ncbi:hypothetical protein BBW65_02420 [Helicobacter enhydrae]|uniref:Type III restriction enzyme C-terminal endonuclease domain-containing protein n=1 Tax=Helicobacter enhydrae TaxID=222136 RepID=A0A1B1U4Q1_9HELI|nr:hypothetical protein [Helicobacter enhydrae]ANV97728.1 hypothetical protein BBW65_02420 [Helicobacter enhydrae]
MKAIINGYLKNTQELSVLVLTNSAIDKSVNRLKRQDENLFSDKTLLQSIMAFQPICFIDEPHLLKGEKFNAVFQDFQTLHFRFGATFPQEEEYQLSNLAYCLDSASAFQRYLVKQINVHTLFEDSLMPKLIDFNSRNATFSYVIDNVTHKARVSFGESLGQILHYPQWNDVEILRSKKDSIFLSNGATIQKLGNAYQLDDHQIKHLIAKAIDLHFAKEEHLFSQGIKALTLFFIPHIDDFREDKNNPDKKPRIKAIFEELYLQKRREILAQSTLSPTYRAYLEKDFDKENKLCVDGGYFSGDKGSNDEKEAQGVKLILEEKEQLLSLDTPLRFIFSVWALQEGWDNPNIFTIVKLASSASQTSRHQQVGRGLRLAVNQNGSRITHQYCNGDDNAFYDVNALDVLISGEEGLFIEELQQEVQESSFAFNQRSLSRGILIHQLKFSPNQADDFIYHLRRISQAIESDENDYPIIKPIISVLQEEKEAFIAMLGEERYQTSIEYFKASTNRYKQINDANKKRPATKIRKNLAQDFKELWHTINQKATITYKEIALDSLIASIADAFNKMSITPQSIMITSKHLNPQSGKIEYLKDEKQCDQVFANQALMMQNYLEFAKSEKLPLNFLLKLYAKLDSSKLAQNPKQALGELKKIIQDNIHTNVISSVSYDFAQTQISNTDLLFDVDGTPKKEILCEKLGRHLDDEISPANYLYEQVVYDSDIEKQVITKDPQSIDDYTIKVFAKLPKFSIPTPYKNYEPDFAYLIKQGENQSIFLICETKGYESEEKIPQQERHKIQYAKKFFEKLQEHLGDKIIINFQTRINTQELRDLLSNITKDKQ